MGFLDFLTGGDKPTQRGPTSAEARVRRLSEELLDSPSRTSLSGLSNLYSRQVGRDNERRRSNVLGTAAADVQQATAGQPTDYGGAVDRALTRARGLSRILRSTSDEYDALQDRARLGVAKAGRGRQGVGLSAIADVASLRERVVGAQQSRSQLSSSLRANRLGAIVGMGIGAIPDIRSAIQSRRNTRSQVGGFGAGAGNVDPSNTAGLV